MKHIKQNFVDEFNLSRNGMIKDTCPVRIGNNVYFGPNCTIETPVHPVRDDFGCLVFQFRKNIPRT